MYEFTVEHRTFIVSKWFECRCAVQVRRAFRIEITAMNHSLLVMVLSKKKTSVFLGIIKGLC